MESILNSIKQMLGITAEQTDFDDEIIIDINTTLNILHQIGIGKKGYSISGPKETWSDFLPEIQDTMMVKTFVYMKVKLMFDPPLNATVIGSMEKQLSELEFRLLENHNDKEEAE